MLFTSRQQAIQLHEIKTHDVMKSADGLVLKYSAHSVRWPTADFEWEYR